MTARSYVISPLTSPSTSVVWVYTAAAQPVYLPSMSDDRVAYAAAYYTQAIGYKALGRSWKAKRMFRKALEQRNDNLWANYYLGNL